MVFQCFSKGFFNFSRVFSKVFVVFLQGFPIVFSSDGCFVDFSWGFLGFSRFLGVFRWFSRDF